MKITNSTPLLVGPFPGRTPANAPALSIVAKGSFRYADGQALVPLAEPLPFAADLFREDDPAGELLYEGDFAPWKPRADILLRGTCHTPGGRSLGSCPVRVTVGRWSKQLLVHGERRWGGPTAGPGVARPFTKQPLGWNAAFGGAGWARNPAGVGYGGTILPPVEDEARLMKTAADTPVEAGFGPLNRAWPQRAGKVGTYGGNYLKERWPGFPADFDWGYFNAAPDDQQVEGYLVGDEQVRLENLHADAPVVSLVLPCWRVRAVVQHLTEQGRRVVLQDVPMALDTLFIDTDERTLVLLWRVALPIENGDMENVLEVMIHADAVAGKPLPLTALMPHLSPPELLMPSRVPTAAPPGAGTRGATAAAGTPGAAPKDAAGKSSAAAGAPKAPAAAAPPAQAAAEKAPTEPPAGGAPPAGGPDSPARPGATPPAPAAPPRPPSSPLMQGIAEVMGATQAERAAGLGALQKFESEMEALLPEAGGSPWPNWPLEPQPTPFTSTQKLLGERGPQPGTPGEIPLENDMARNADLDFAPLEQSLAALAAPPPEKSPPTRASVQALALQPGGLKQADLAGAALGGMELAGADLTGANLTGTDLAGARLAGAQLPHAVLAGAQMANANLAGCDLTGADLTGADLTGADLTGAKLPWADLSGAKLAGARLSAADATQALFMGADLSKASLKGARLKSADFSKATLDGADFSTADATEARFTGATGARVVFEKATLAGTKLDETRFEKGKFTGIKAARSIWECGFLAGADFEGAELTDAFFEKANLERARFSRCQLAGARFKRARLVEARVTDANLFRASLEKADLTGADFSRSNLFEVEFLESVLRNTLFEGTNLTRTKLAAV